MGEKKLIESATEWNSWEREKKGNKNERMDGEMDIYYGFTLHFVQLHGHLFVGCNLWVRMGPGHEARVAMLLYTFFHFIFVCNIYGSLGVEIHGKQNKDRNI